MRGLATSCPVMTSTIRAARITTGAGAAGAGCCATASDGRMAAEAIASADWKRKCVVDDMVLAGEGGGESSAARGTNLPIRARRSNRLIRGSPLARQPFARCPHSRVASDHPADELVSRLY